MSLAGNRVDGLAILVVTARLDRTGGGRPSRQPALVFLELVDVVQQVGAEQ